MHEHTHTDAHKYILRHTQTHACLYINTHQWWIQGGCCQCTPPSTRLAPPYEVGTPPMGNPGSAAAHTHTDVHIGNVRKLLLQTTFTLKWAKIVTFMEF